MNIFYSQVDDAVQRELNARGNSGKNRTTADINFMAGKIANVQVTAYKSGSADPSMQYPGEYGILGGKSVLGPRFQPSSKGGFLTNPEYTIDTIKFDETGKAKLAKQPSPNSPDNSRRIGPIITAVSIDIGDHSMGLLNKATVNITIPNPTRDLDAVEEVWFYPGRYVKIDVVYPNSAIITGADENLIATSSLFGSLPPDEVDKNLKKLYPSVSNLDKFKRQRRKLNEFSFQGLITSFDFSYTEDGTVDATISLTGTSNTYTDVTMLMNPNTKKTDEQKTKSYTTLATSSVAELQAAGQPTGSTEFYGLLYNNFEELISTFKQENQIKDETPLLIPFTTTNIKNNQEKTSPTPDRFILYGEMYPHIEIPKFVAGPTGSLTVVQQRENFNKKYQPYTQTQRYITLGALISFINEKILPKLAGSAQSAKIDCDYTQHFSNYYPSLTSCAPKDILLLPHKTDLNANAGGMNRYGNLTLYPDILTKMAPYSSKEVLQWSGIKDTTNNVDRIYPSKIFINLEYIQQVLNGLSALNTKTFTISSFLQNISNRIAFATGNAIVMKLVSSPDDLNKLVFADTKYLKPIDPDPKKKVTKYSVPMLANHPNGTVVQTFTFQAKLPSNVKNLSYVLNSGTDVSDDEIAPYLNFMYNSKDPAKINEARAKYEEKHGQVLANLNDAKTEYGKIPFVDEHTIKLSKALLEYIKYPFADLTTAQQLTAPIFPFDVEFTIDGINGLRYGDVLTFDGLPEKYRRNTVFSIIGITHDVEISGQWTTKVKCIMRPEIG